MPIDDDDDLTSLIEAKSEEFQEEGAPQWMATFSDLMSLLLAFFILMFSMSEVKMAKFMAAAESLRAGLGMSDVPADSQMGKGAPFSGSDTLQSFEESTQFHMSEITERVKRLIRNNNLAEILDVKQSNQNVTIFVQSVAVFKSGSARITEEGQEIVDLLATVVRQIEYPVIIRGHTDNIPIKSKIYPSNWELSAARAGSVARYFQQSGCDPKLFHVEGYADMRPVASNDSREGRERNRRVELVYTKDNVAETLGLDNDDSLFESPENLKEDPDYTPPDDDAIQKLIEQYAD